MGSWGKTRDPFADTTLDARGTNWHFSSDHVKCREQPCTALCCQICGLQGHTAAMCSKRQKRVPGLNLHGYYQESKPNSYAVRYETAKGADGERPAHNFGAPPRSNAATPAAPPAFPHFVNGSNSNNTSRRTPNSHPVRSAKVNHANQTQDDGAASKPSNSDSSQRDGQ
jgi:hypothetical protein